MRLSMQWHGATDGEIMFCYDVFWGAAEELGLIDCRVTVDLTLQHIVDMPPKTGGQTCSWCNDPYRMAVATGIGFAETGRILCHEMIHLKQMLLDGLMSFEGDDGEHYAVWNGQTIHVGDKESPVEREAYEGQGPLFDKVLSKLEAQMLKEPDHATA